MSSRQIGQERRRREGDRRKSPRPGKFERRKNTCGHCVFFKPKTTEVGLCTKHMTDIRADEYACVWFAARPVEE